MTRTDEILGSIALPGVEEGHGKLWPKTQKAFQYVWEHHRDDADWFFKADDDTYVFTDNLRSFVRSHDPNKAHYFGAVADYGNTTVVNLGGAGNVRVRITFVVEIGKMCARHFSVHYFLHRLRRKQGSAAIIHSGRLAGSGKMPYGDQTAV